jgi:hypothetical protein
MKSFPISGAARAALVLTLAAGLGACASVIQTKHADWAVRSMPEGAEVKVSNGGYCQATPCTFQVRRNEHFFATVAMPGYETKTVEVNPELKPLGAVSFLGNGVFGLLGVLTAAIDVGNGSAFGPSHNGETIKLKAYSAQDLIRLGAADDGCTPEKAVYARQIGVSCDALGTRVMFVHDSVLTPAAQLAATAGAQPTQVAADQPVDTQPLQAAAQPAQTPPAPASAPQPVADASPQPTQSPADTPVKTAAADPAPAAGR